MERGPSYKGRPRLGKPCPEQMVELHLAEKTGWRIMPTGLSPGQYDDQPAADLLFWMGLMSFEAGEREKIETKLHAEAAKKAKRR